MIIDTRYYVLHPNGRERLNANTDAEAKDKFSKHWTVKAVWNCKQTSVRQLVKEVRNLLSEEIIKC